MKIAISAAAAALIVGTAAAWAQPDPTAPAASAAAPAPAINYVSPCTKPKTEATPAIPNPATVKPSESAKANREYSAWHATVQAFTACKKAELDGIQAQVKQEQEKSPFGRQIIEYNAHLDSYEKGLADFKATTIPVPGVDPKKLKKPGATCPTPPAVAPAPIPTLNVAEAKKSEISKAQKAFGEWMEPRYVYLTCAEAELKGKGAETDAAVAPLKAKYDAAFADYKTVSDQAKVVTDKWNAFAVAYNARLKAAAGN
jgi:hypothetical protein